MRKWRLGRVTWLPQGQIKVSTGAQIPAFWFGIQGSFHHRTVDTGVCTVFIIHFKDSSLRRHRGAVKIDLRAGRFSVANKQFSRVFLLAGSVAVAFRKALAALQQTAGPRRAQLFLRSCLGSGARHRHCPRGHGARVGWGGGRRVLLRCGDPSEEPGLCVLSSKLAVALIWIRRNGLVGPGFLCPLRPF